MYTQTNQTQVLENNLFPPSTRFQVSNEFWRQVITTPHYQYKRYTQKSKSVFDEKTRI
jgi:hypothetical protein